MVLHNPPSPVPLRAAATGLRRIKICTQRTEIHEAEEGDDPEILEVDHLAMVELGKSRR